VPLTQYARGGSLSTVSGLPVLTASSSHSTVLLWRMFVSRKACLSKTRSLRELQCQLEFGEQDRDEIDSEHFRGLPFCKGRNGGFRVNQPGGKKSQIAPSPWI
jgi:hypothetical protein